MLYRYFINVGALETEDKTGWIGCWYIYDRAAKDALQPLLSGRSGQAWGDAASSLVAAYEEGQARVGELIAEAGRRR